MPEKTNATGCDVLFYVQHLLGIGHLQRAAVLARALQVAGLRTWLVSGGVPVEEVSIAGIKIVQLPPARALDAGFALVDEAGNPVSGAWKEHRRGALMEVFNQARPRCLLIELFPFGRRQMRFELLPLLEAARDASPRPTVVTSLRDILNRQNKPEKAAWMIETFERYFDFALVHGDPAFMRLEESFPEAASIADRLRYTGFIVRPIHRSTGPRSGETSNGEVLVSVGGGAVGAKLLQVALAARARTSLGGHPWRLLAGPNLPEEDFERLRSASANTTIERARSDFADLLAACRLSISQAGYNTVMEVLSLRKPSVVVPFAQGGETEQTVRAERLAAAGCLEMVAESELAPERLARAIERAASVTESERASRPIPDLDGARKTATILRQILEGRGDGELG